MISEQHVKNYMEEQRKRGEEGEGGRVGGWRYRWIEEKSQGEVNGWG